MRVAISPTFSITLIQPCLVCGGNVYAEPLSVPADQLADWRITRNQHAYNHRTAQRRARRQLARLTAPKD